MDIQAPLAEDILSFESHYKKILEIMRPIIKSHSCLREGFKPRNFKIFMELLRKASEQEEKDRKAAAQASQILLSSDNDPSEESSPSSESDPSSESGPSGESSSRSGNFAGNELSVISES
eukprot:CAMPEP_0116883602 /NCGR_PEP_ID=MMETSP0463-20121206/16147_1 /TAXON_ID=181622 /ORGANISM="Strombidinopsis sp, Strain SopsisLIS2011" /LENGTH=119 /DNA_ID=CAMNT_0004538577 /DNA_START=218 /DNA_END=577 /DNA_ORIENTATION=+